MTKFIPLRRNLWGLRHSEDMQHFLHKGAIIIHGREIVLKIPTVLLCTAKVKPTPNFWSPTSKFCITKHLPRHADTHRFEGCLGRLVL